MIDVWACVPVKEFTGAKQRLASLLTPVQREILAETMLEDVLSALAGATRLAGILVNTVDPRAAAEVFDAVDVAARVRVRRVVPVPAVQLHRFTHDASPLSIHRQDDFEHTRFGRQFHQLVVFVES